MVELVIEGAEEPGEIEAVAATTGGRG